MTTTKIIHVVVFLVTLLVPILVANNSNTENKTAKTPFLLPENVSPIISRLEQINSQAEADQPADKFAENILGDKTVLQHASNLNKTWPPFSVTGGIPTWVDTWLAPKEFISWFPYYLTGHDLDGIPVYVLEMGNFEEQAPVRKLLGSVEKAKETTARYLQQAVYNILRDGRANGTQGVALIVDYRGFELRKYADSAAIELVLGVMSHLNLIYSVLNYAFLINVNFAAENFIRIAKPLIGNILDKCEFFGPQKSKWLPQLLRRIHPSQLPDWYGGTTKNWRPVWLGGGRRPHPSASKP